jgi:structural maintenance of chromosome 2
MKPIEVLGLIEEAAGTSLYQHKRDDALNRIKKKELKLQEIDSILRQEVTPKLEQLQKDKSFLDEYKAKTSQLEQHEKS